MVNNYKESLINSIKKHNETVYLTIGFRWKNPSVMDRPLEPKSAIDWINRMYGYYAKIELNDRDGKLHLNAYTQGDMW